MKRIILAFGIILFIFFGASAPALAVTKWVELQASNAIRASAVAVGDADNIWVLDMAKTAYRYSFGEWQEMPGQMFDGIAAGVDGTVIGIQFASSICQHNQFYRFDTTTEEWEYLASMSQDRNISSLSVGSETSIWGIDRDTGYPCYWDGTRWIDAGSERLTAIAAGADDTVIGVNGRTSKVYFRNDTDWVYTSGVGPQFMVSAGDAQSYLFTDRDGNATVYLGGSPYRPGSPRMISAGIGADGTTLGVAADGRVYEMAIDDAGHQRRFLPQEVRRKDLPFLIAFSKGYGPYSITNWSTLNGPDAATAAFKILKNHGFNGVLIGYAPKGQNELPDQAFNYDPVDVAHAQGMKTIIDISKYIKADEAISYTDNAKSVVHALETRTSGKDAIAAIHLYGEVDRASRGKAVNAVAKQVTAFPTLAVAQENHTDFLPEMGDVTVRAANYDDPDDLQRGVTPKDKLSFGLIPLRTDRFWYLVPWVRDYTSSPHLPWNAIYGALGMGARGLIWTPSREMGGALLKDKLTAATQYVEDINKKLLGAGLDELISVRWKNGKLSPNPGAEVKNRLLYTELRAYGIALNQSNGQYHAGLFVKCSAEEIHSVKNDICQKTEAYYVLLLNWQDKNQAAAVMLNTDRILDGKPTYLSADKPQSTISETASLEAERKPTIKYKTLSLTLPPHGIVLLKLQGK